MPANPAGTGEAIAGKARSYGRGGRTAAGANRGERVAAGQGLGMRRVLLIISEPDRA
jgi:hypothetical protein